MITVLLTFIVSLLIAKVIVYTYSVHAKISSDDNYGAIQRMHDVPVPRIGGLAIFTSMVFTALYGANLNFPWSQFYSGMIVSLFFVFIGGLTEDMSKEVSPLVRLLFVTASVVFAVFIVHTMNMIRHLEHETINQVLRYDIIAFIITCVAVVGMSNAFNIIDGYNGLSSTTALINSAALAYLSHKFGDSTSLLISCSMFAAILGFWLFNYPFGKLFLGDGGAYLIGFMISLVSINLVESHVGTISPFTVLLLSAYPFTETIFTIVRRKFVHKTRATQPDNLHLHQLIFTRCLHSDFSLKFRNARVMPLMLIMIIPQNICAFLFYDSTKDILICLLLYVLYYTYIYMTLVKFKTPKILLLLAYLLANRKVKAIK